MLNFIYSIYAQSLNGRLIVVFYRIIYEDKRAFTFKGWMEASVCQEWFELKVLIVHLYGFVIQVVITLQSVIIVKLTSRQEVKIDGNKAIKIRQMIVIVNDETNAWEFGINNNKRNDQDNHTDKNVLQKQHRCYFPDDTIFSRRFIVKLRLEHHQFYIP